MAKKVRKEAVKEKKAAQKIKMLTSENNDEKVQEISNIKLKLKDA